MAFFGKSKKEETSIVNYDEELIKNKIVLLIVPNKRYNAELIHLVNTVMDKCGCSKIGYISLNKPAQRIVDLFKREGIDTKKFLFVDTVTKGAKPTATSANITYIDSLKNFKQFEADLNKIIEKKEFHCIIFDSLSTMLIYEDQNTITRFVHDFITRLMVCNDSGKFTCLAEDVHSDLIKDISMFVDKVIDLSEKKPAEKKDWEKEEKIAKFEVELDSVRKAYSAKLLSEASYLTTKKRIEANIKRLGK